MHKFLLQQRGNAYMRKEFDKVIEEYIDDNSYTDYWGEEVLTPGGALGLVQKKRQVASSVYAYLNNENDLDAGRDAFESYTDSKFEELLRIIDEVFKHGTKKIVIFALFRRTLKYLQNLVLNFYHTHHLVFFNMVIYSLTLENQSYKTVINISTTKYTSSILKINLYLYIIILKLTHDERFRPSQSQ